MPPAIIDACCLIDLMVTGHEESILRAAGFTWYLPSAVVGEVRYLRRHDPDRPGATITAPADLTPLIAAGVLAPCEPDDPRERARFVHYAARFRSDGEAMCLALAEARGWTVATDDRKAIRIATEAGLPVVSCPQIVKAWADATRPDAHVVGRVIADIQTLAQFRPKLSTPESSWWAHQIGE